MTRRPAIGAATRKAIVRLAADQASVDGLEGLSIGQLARLEADATPMGRQALP